MILVPVLFAIACLTWIFLHLFEKWLWIPVHILVIQYELGSSCTVLSLVFYGQGYDETIPNMIVIGLAR